MSADIVIKLQQLRAELTESLHTFNAWFPEHVCEAVVYEIPLLKLDAAPESIPMSTYYDQAAVAKTQAMLTAFTWLPEQAPVQTRRLPGVIVLDESPQPYLDAINGIKSQIKSLMSQTSAGHRARIRKKAFGPVSMLQIYRHIFYESAQPRRCVFSWIGNTFASQTKTIAEVRALLVESRLNPPQDYEPDDWLTVIDIELEKLAKPPAGATIKRRKPLAPHPRMILYRHPEFRTEQVNTQAPDVTHHANLPLFVCQSPHPMTINSLTDFERNDSYTPRRKTTRTLPLIEKLNLYWVRPNP